MADAGSPLHIETIDDVVERGSALRAAPLYVAAPDEDPLAWVFYTSGTTGTPKGAMFTESLCIGTWLAQSDQPVITLSYMPMSHLIGYGYVIMTLANGGTSYFAAKSDLSTLFDDLAMARPTTLSLVPRVCEMFFHQYLSELDRRTLAGADPDDAGSDITTAMREQLLGGRVLAVGCGSAALSPEIKVFMESVLDQHLMIGYSSTEIAGGMIVADEHVLRPPVIDYKLLDVPELGYFNTDKPYPRGELAVKSARFMAGYYKRPDLTAAMFDEDGYYKTGDIMAEVGPDRLRYRRPAQQRHQALAGRVRRRLAPGGAVLHQPADPADLHLRQQRAVLPARRGRAHRGRRRPNRRSRESLLQIARDNQLNGYEIPRDFLIETEPFSLENGLLSGVGKFLRPKLKDRYGAALGAAVRQDGRRPDQRAARAAGRRCRPAGAGDRWRGRCRPRSAYRPATSIPEARFIDLGGDSLSALTFSRLLADIFGVEVPVGVMVDPTGDLLAIANIHRTAS